MPLFLLLKLITDFQFFLHYKLVFWIQILSQSVVFSISENDLKRDLRFPSLLFVCYFNISLRLFFSALALLWETHSVLQLPT